MLVLVLSGPAWAREALPAGAVLVVGDSLSAGYGVAPDQAWPALLDTRWRAQGLPYRVVNASVSGQTSAGGRALLARALQSADPVLVVVQLGANDALRGQDLGATADNLTAMVNACQAAGARVLLAGIELPPNYGARYTQRLRAVYRDVAAATGAALMPFLLADIATDRALFQPDGLHPTAAGLDRVADAVARAIGTHFSLAGPRAPGGTSEAAAPAASAQTSE